MDVSLEQSTDTLSLKKATQSEEVLLSIEDLKVWFELRRFGFGHAGYVRAVDGVSFSLKNGEAIAVVGESGCGKSSLMKTILGLNKPTEGRVVFLGKDINLQSGDAWRWYRSQVGYVQQDPYGALPPFMNVQTILEEPLIIGGVRDKRERLDRVIQALDEVRMIPVSDFLEKFPHMLSGGQQQRVVIARSMIMNPKLLVADEPVSMLDASVRVEILKLMRNLQERHNLAVLYITHDLSTVRYFSERIFVMYAGRLVEIAGVDDLINHGGHPYTQALLAGTSEPDANNARIFKEVPPGEPPSLVNPPSGCRFHPRCPQFMKGICEVAIPPDFNVSTNHYIACYLFDPALERPSAN